MPETNIPSSIQAIMAELERKAADPVWQAQEAKRAAEVEQRQRWNAHRIRLAMIEAIGAPLRVGMAETIAAIPRHLVAADCECDRDVNGAKCVVPDGYEDWKGVDLVRRWMDARRKQPLAWKPILGILGGTGIGKTVASTWAISRNDGDYVKTRALTIAHRAMFGDEATAWRKLMRSPLLVIDDLGRETDDHGIAAVEDAIDERQSRPTIITGNITKPQLLSRYGDRVASRLAESGVLVWIDDEDRRRS